MISIENAPIDQMVTTREHKRINMEPDQQKTTFSDSYFVDEILGTGGFSVVKRCRHKETKCSYAVKIINSKKLAEAERKELETEIRICLRLQHCNVIRLVESFPETEFFYLIFELVTGGELFDNIVERECYSEMDASICIQQILEALSYCHSNGIIHRDIKPENLLLANKLPNAKVKLTDFGLAIEAGSTPKFYGMAGTPCYMAPEILRREPYGVEIDCWSCGCILYLLLIGYPPFWSSDQKKLYESIKEGAYSFESKAWQTISFEAKSVIRRLLIVNKKRRFTTSDALLSSWISQRERTALKSHRQETVESLRSFNARRKFRSAIFTTKLLTDMGRRCSGF